MSYKTMVPCPARTSMNTGLNPARVATLKAVFGEFPHLGSECGSVKNKKVAAMLETRNVGPFRATGIKPALDDLEAIFAEIKFAHPDLYAMLGTAGMTCYRCVRGYPGAPSNHAAGTAIDMTVGGVLTEFDADEVPAGLIVLYGYFHRYKWYWGAGYNGRRDGMHFEVSDERLRDWDAKGVI